MAFKPKDSYKHGKPGLGPPPPKSRDQIGKAAAPVRAALKRAPGKK